MRNKFICFCMIISMACISVGCRHEEDVVLSNSSSSIGDDENDLVENQSWTSSLNIVWNGNSATISGSVDGVTVSANNGYITVISTVDNVVYNLSGSGTGQLSIYSNYKLQLALQGLTLSCSNGPVINNQSDRTCYVVVSGTNSLSDASTYASSLEDRKAAFFSEGQLCFSGSGSLSITGNYKHALASDSYIRLCPNMTATLDITAKVNDGMHANEGIIINDGTLAVNSKDECIRADANTIKITGGTITAVSQSEAIESKGTITISGGHIYAQAADDAINAGGNLTISGGYVCAYSTGNDGIDANGNCYINGGLIYAIGASSPEVAIDALEKCTLYVNGGTLVALGGLESGAILNQSCYSTSSWSKNTWYGLTVGSNVFAFKTPGSGGTTLVVSGASTPVLASDVTASGTAVFNGMGYYPASASGGSSVTLSSYTGGNGGNNPGGGGLGGGGTPPGGFGH